MPDSVRSSVDTLIASLDGSLDPEREVYAALARAVATKVDGGRYRSEDVKELRATVEALRPVEEVSDGLDAFLAGLRAPVRDSEAPAPAHSRRRGGADRGSARDAAAPVAAAGGGRRAGDRPAD